MPTASDVTELRLVVTAENHDAALAFDRDALGLPQLEACTHDAGRAAILDAGRATLEPNDPTHAAHIDDVEVGGGRRGVVRGAAATRTRWR